MSGQRILVIGRDRLFLHAGEIIVGLVVFAHVVDAERVKQAFRTAAFRCLVRACVFASRPLAGRRFLTQYAFGVRLDPDAIENLGVGFHWHNYGALRALEQGIFGGQA